MYVMVFFFFHLQLKQMVLVCYNWFSDSYPVCLSAERTFRKVKARWVSWEGTNENIDGSNRISEMFLIEMIKREFFDNGFRLSMPFRNKSTNLCLNANPQRNYQS